MQGGPGVFKGDLYFYKLDGDIRGRVAQIDTRRCPLFLLSGEYDYSCTPQETLDVARSIPGSEVTIMKGLGHFPMSENPQEFLKHLLPVLEKIREIGDQRLSRPEGRGAVSFRIAARALASVALKYSSRSRSKRSWCARKLSIRACISVRKSLAAAIPEIGAMTGKVLGGSTTGCSNICLISVAAAST